MQAQWMVTLYSEVETSDVLMALCATEDDAKFLAHHISGGYEGPCTNRLNLQAGDRYSHTRAAWFRGTERIAGQVQGD